MRHKLKHRIFIVMILMIISPTTAKACTRLTYDGLEHVVVTGRSMDWVEDIQTDLWAIPAGITKIGSSKPNSIQWTSKYGSVIASGYNIATTDGINVTAPSPKGEGF